jgi:mannose-1-phosphate guanylyltransferase/phosphomannomutase
VKLKNGVKVSENVFIGDNVKIGSDAVIRSGVKIWPEKTVDGSSVVMKSLVWEDRWKDSLFTDSRITGLANIEITSEFAARLGEVFGVFTGIGSRVNISRDTDHISRMIKGALISGLMSSGVDVIDLQTTPVPILRQELRSGKASGGVFVRKSPFDASKADIIFFDSTGKDLSGAKTKTIERLYFSGDHQPIPYFEIGSVAYSERTLERYKEHFMSHINAEPINRKRFRIVINYSHGITSSIFPVILGEFNIELVSLDTHLDSSKQIRSHEEFTNALKKLSYVVTSLKYDAGFLIDAGGEKIFMVDDSGKLISNDRFLTLVTKLFLTLYPGADKIAVPIQATSEIDIIAKNFGTKVLRVKDSHFAMMNAAGEPGVGMVGGTKGGVIFPEFLFATDGMYAVMKILEMLALLDKSLSQLEKECPRLYMTKHNLFCTKEFKGRIMRKLVEDSEGRNRQLIDGIKIFYAKNRWVLCIPDSERDIFHINAEAKSQTEADKLVRLYSNKISRWLKELSS